MKVVVLGAGTIVPDFLEAVSKISQLEVYGIFGREKNIDRLTQLKEQYGITKIFHDYDEVLKDSSVDVIYVALPNHLHYAFAKKAVEHKKHVIVEKPFASTIGQARELVNMARENGVVVFEAISNQYMPNYEKTRNLVKELGDIKIVQMNYSQYSRRYDLFKEGVVLPVFDPKKSGGALMDINVYNIHYIVGLFGKPETVCYMANMERGIDTSGVLMLGYPSFKCVSVGAKDCKAPVSINIQGDKGYIHSDRPANEYGSFVFAYNDRKEESFSLNEGMPRLYYELKAFVSGVENAAAGNLKEAEAYNQHTLIVMEILDEARHQAGLQFEDEA